MCVKQSAMSLKSTRRLQASTWCKLETINNSHTIAFGSNVCPTNNKVVACGMERQKCVRSGLTGQEALKDE